MVVIFFNSNCIGGSNLWIVQDQRNKFACVGLIMTTLVKVRIPSLVTIMLTCWREEWSMVEENACSYFHPMWKPTSRVMATKVSQTTSYVFVHSLPWAQFKRWIPIGSMGCGHTHWGRLAIEKCGNLNYVWSNVEKIRENHRKVGKISWIINQTFTLRLKHDKIWAWWAWSISSKNMLENIWWCKCSKMEIWRWTICCLMNCSKGKKHTCARTIEDCMLLWGVVRKGRCYCQFVLKLQKGKDIGQPWTW
jgi:hypothetical protein